MFFLLAADDTGGLQPTPENLHDVDAALADLADDPGMGSFGSGPYWPRIREQLLATSSSQDPHKAIKEWKYVRSWIQDHGQCELCGKRPIKYQFQIENRINGNHLVLGSECIHNYLVIPGVPSKAILKKRLSQIRTVAKAVARGEAAEGAVQEVEALHAFERSVNLLIGKISAPDKDIDVSDFEATFADVMYRLGFVFSTSETSRALTDIQRSVTELQRFLRDLRTRSRLYKSTHLLPAVEAIMRLHGTGERRSKLEQLYNLLTSAFRLGRAEETIEMAWTEFKSSQKQLVAHYQEVIENAKTRVQTQYAETLRQLHPYPHLAFTIQAGINLAKAQIDKDAAAIFKALDTLASGGKVTRLELDTSKFSSRFTYRLDAQRSSVEAEALSVAAWYHVATSSTGIDSVVRQLEAHYGIRGIQDHAGITKSLLQAVDDGILEPTQGIQFGLTQNKKLMELLEVEVDEVAAFLKSKQKEKVYEAFGNQLRFDVRKFYESIPLKVEHSFHDFLLRFGRDIFDQWQQGRMNSLSYKQREIIMKRDRKAQGRTLWDELESEFNQPYQPVYAYNR